MIGAVGPSSRIGRKFLERQSAWFSSISAPRTLYDKVWTDHVIDQQDDGTALIYIDRHLVHEVTSPQAFDGLRLAGRRVRQPKRTLVTPDHNVSTALDRGISFEKLKDPASRNQIAALDSNAKEFALPYFNLGDKRQGIVHIVGPEQGFSLPGMTMVCGDSHTSTHGAFGALAFGIGTSEVEHVLATQTLLQKKSKNMLVNVDGDLSFGVTAKDVILRIIGEIGTAGGTGSVIEFGGKVFRDLSMEERMTVCNMAIEAGARAGMIAPDDVTFEYLKNRPLAPKGDDWDKAVNYWSTLRTDEGAHFDRVCEIDGASIAPQVTWGTNPEMVAPIDGKVPKATSDSITRALKYMGLEEGTVLEEVKIDKVFVGSCTNGRIEDLRNVAALVKETGLRVHKDIKLAMIVPGSGLVKRQAEEEGVADVLKEAGFDWRAPGCSMCLGMNEDQLEPEERCASTSNRNFEGRQGKLGRTHLVSPAMAAAAALTGRLTDVRKLSKAGQRRAFSSSSKANSGMEPFILEKGVAAPMPLDNIDTDMIIPAVFLKTIKRTGLGVSLFAAMRYDESGAERPEFVLNQDAYRNSKFIIAGDNFGCGSSREHAPWALKDFGIKGVISTSFADIFFNNCFKNGILPISLSKEAVDGLMKDAEKGSEIEVDLEKQVVRRPNGEEISFEVEEFRKYCLLNGLDDIGLTLQKEAKISEYETRRKADHPWF